MTEIFIALGGATYALIAARAAIVTYRARIAYGVEGKWPVSSMFGAVWPLTAPVLGFIVLMSGDPGIFRAQPTLKTAQASEARE